MRVCFPVQSHEGLDSMVYGHFGSAPTFLIVDRSTDELVPVSNGDSGHAHGKCSPIKALGGREIDCVIVGGIGTGALNKLMAMGVEVYRASEGDIRQNLAALDNGSLPKFNASLTCGGHSAGNSGAKGGCSHH